GIDILAQTGRDFFLRLLHLRILLRDRAAQVDRFLHRGLSGNSFHLILPQTAASRVSSMFCKVVSTLALAAKDFSITSSCCISSSILTPCRFIREAAMVAPAVCACVAWFSACTR